MLTEQGLAGMREEIVGTLLDDLVVSGGLGRGDVEGRRERAGRMVEARYVECRILLCFFRSYQVTKEG